MSELQISDADQAINGPMAQMVTTYDAFMQEITLGREDVLRDRTIALAQIKPGDCVLEVGCGTGTLSLAAKRQAGPAGQVFGIDVIPGMIEVSQQKAAQANEAITFQLASINDMPFPENQFDVVMCSFMIFHMSEATRRAGISEIQRVLKPGGVLLILDISLPTEPEAKALARRALGGMEAPDMRDLIPILNGSDFSDVEFGPADFEISGFSVIGYVRGRARKD